jgi:hypothetical protein
VALLPSALPGVLPSGLCAREAAGVPLAELAVVPALLLAFFPLDDAAPPSRTLRASLSLPLPAPPRTASEAAPRADAPTAALALERLRAAPDSVPLAPEASGDAAVLLLRESLGFLRVASLPLASDCRGEPGRLTPAAFASFLRPDGVFSPRVVWPDRGSFFARSPSLRSLSEPSSEFFSSLSRLLAWPKCL